MYSFESSIFEFLATSLPPQSPTQFDLLTYCWIK